MFSTMARLLCTLSPSSLCIKKSMKRTNYIITILPTCAWLEFYNVPAMARLLSIPSPSSLCTKKSIKRTIYIIERFPAHAWSKFNNVLHNGQAVLHTVSLLSVYQEKHKKDNLYYKKLSSTCLVQIQQCSPQWPGCCAHRLPPLCVKRKE